MSGHLAAEKDRIELEAASESGKKQPAPNCFIKPLSDTTIRNPNEIRLQDIEEQLEMAENRCNTLKDQLDYMKKMYGVNRDVMPLKQRKISNAQGSTGAIESVDSSEKTSTIKDEPKRIASPNRQKSNHIGTDNTGAAVRTINNILNGITNSVNRLSEIHSQLTTPRVKVSTGVTAGSERVEGNVVGLVPELKIDSSTTVMPKPRGQKRKAGKSAKTVSQHTIFKKPARVEKKIRSVITKSNAGLDKKSSTVIKNRLFSKFNSKNNNLVEIYHNDAVKHSDSDESNMKKSRQHCERPSNEEVPPLNIQALNMPRKDNGQDQTAKSDLTYPVGFAHQYPYEPPEAPRTTISCVYSKNYELPTVASRMKQVAKSYLGTLNLKTIPFCAAISTTQSHNIGINIQQVMNIIKNRQPINGISPTLAHNIGLAAEKLHDKPFSALVSTINSRISQTASRCPLSRTYMNFQQLQEQAKSIPEETIEEAEEEAGESPEVQTMIITGPSGDMEIKTNKAPSWKIDKNVSGEQCTCTEGLQQVANRYQRNIRTITENSLNSQIMENQLKKRLRRYRTTAGNTVDPRVAAGQEGQAQTADQKSESLHGKERNLKQVLANLHDDFDSLNRRYEDLSLKSQTDGNDVSIRELERLEKELTKKEEEITMVMTLYKEVLALKQQVKQLREKHSQSSLPSKEHKETKIKFKGYNNPEAAFHLTKLLKQIQHYQMRYKSNLSQE